MAAATCSTPPRPQDLSQQPQPPARQRHLSESGSSGMLFRTGTGFAEYRSALCVPAMSPAKSVTLRPDELPAVAAAQSQAEMVATVLQSNEDGLSRSVTERLSAISIEVLETARRPLMLGDESGWAVGVTSNFISLSHLSLFWSESGGHQKYLTKKKMRLACKPVSRCACRPPYCSSRAFC